MSVQPLSDGAQLLTEFERHRPLLFSIAYRMLGSASEAEDMVQETFLRLQSQRSEPVHNPKYFLTTIITRLCINQLNSARYQREEYLGPWLPEPILTEHSGGSVNPAERIMTIDYISIAFLVLLESLSPSERAVFLLKEVFDYRFREIAEMVNKSEAACRQLFHRAKKHIAANRPRFAAEPTDHDRFLQQFIETVETGEIDSFLEMLAEDITLVPDGGGERGAAIRVVKGKESVSAFILGTRRLAPAGLRFEVRTLNGQRAILGIDARERPFFALFFYYQEDGEIQMIHVIAGRKLQSIEI